MELQNIPPEEYQLMACLSNLPEKIMAVHRLPNATEFILYALCKESGLPICRIAYFVDNPDFDWCKGVAGVSRDDRFDEDFENLWEQTDSFTQAMQNAPFNKCVRECSCSSFGSDYENDRIAYIKQKLQLHNPTVFTVPIKNDNLGVLVVEDMPQKGEVGKHLRNAVCLLGMCPVF